MRRNDFVLSFGVTIFLALVSSCGQLTKGTPTPSATASVEPVRSITPAPSFIPPPTDSTTQTPTPVVIPTLPIEGSQTRLLQLLSDNGNCRLPCLWGITPGESSFEVAQAVLVPLSSSSYSVYLNPPGPGSITPRYAESDLEIYTNVAFLANPDDNIVNRIAFNAEAHRLLKEGGYEDVFDSTFFREKTSAYALPYVLTKQGIPSSITISTFGGPLTRGGVGGFDIVLLYPTQGVFVKYTTQMQISENNVRGCPQNAHVEMELFPPGDADNFFAQLEKTNWPYFKEGFKPLEEVTTMSVHEFYEIFRGPTNKCINTPTNLWPTQEP